MLQLLGMGAEYDCSSLWCGRSGFWSCLPVLSLDALTSDPWLGHKDLAKSKCFRSPGHAIASHRRFRSRTALMVVSAASFAEAVCDILASRLLIMYSGFANRSLASCSQMKAPSFLQRSWRRCFWVSCPHQWCWCFLLAGPSPVLLWAYIARRQLRLRNLDPSFQMEYSVFNQLMLNLEYCSSSSWLCCMRLGLLGGLMRWSEGSDFLI